MTATNLLNNDSRTFRRADGPPTVREAYNTFVRYLEQIRCRLTRPRLRIARWLLSLEPVFREHEINLTIAQRGLPIGPRSVARTLDLLVQCGLLIRISQGANKIPAYLSLARRKHGTLTMLCVECLELRETALPEDSLASTRIASSNGYTMKCAFHIVKGVCRKCKSAQ